MTWTEVRRGWDGAAPAVALAGGLLIAPALHGFGVGVALVAVGGLAVACSVGVRLRTAGLVALLGWALVTGFDVHRYGDLLPLNGADLDRLAVLGVIASVGCLLSGRLLALVRRAAAGLTVGATQTRTRDAASPRDGHRQEVGSVERR